MGIPTKPGISFEDLWDLVEANEHILTNTGIEPELVMGIFWEETLFNNVFQTSPGTAVGFGQVEPREFYRFNANCLNARDPGLVAFAKSAQAKGYLIYNLPSVVYHGKDGPVTLSAPLTDEQSVQVALASIRDLHERGKSAGYILYGYAGVGFKGEQAAHLARPGGREAIIKGWQDCAKILVGAIPNIDKDAILKALKLARPFNKDEEFRNILFPN